MTVPATARTHAITSQAFLVRTVTRVCFCTQVIPKKTQRMIMSAPDSAMRV